MKQILTVIITLMLGISCSNASIKAAQNQLISDYKKTAASLVSLNKRNGDSSKIKTLALELIAKAKPIMKNHKTAHPQCGELLDTVMNKAAHMTNINLKAIEADYHDGKALPQSPDECYEAKELIVHPATVVILTKEKLSKSSREKINDEIEEVLAHIDNLQI